jgi:hypothetical protein
VVEEVGGCCGPLRRLVLACLVPVVLVVVVAAVPECPCSRCYVVVHVVTMVSTSFVTLVFLVCLQTVLLSTVSNCAKTISMYWNTTNSM